MRLSGQGINLEKAWPEKPSSNQQEDRIKQALWCWWWTTLTEQNSGFGTHHTHLHNTDSLDHQHSGRITAHTRPTLHHARKPRSLLVAQALAVQSLHQDVPCAQSFQANPTVRAGRVHDTSRAQAPNTAAP